MEGLTTTGEMYYLNRLKVQQGETLQVGVHDKIIHVEWESLGKFCWLTVLRQVDGIPD